ncbi:MAG TPA: MHYT domain-containing protein [Pseudolabrys sp.]|jgi:NO-binding membrane sensor protein with MHYT domain|nr:MHYT domain-containing protein [Pseudolabrys sp.]
MQLAYEPWLVLLSIVMAIQGAYVGFTLAVQVGDAVGMRRRVLLAGAAFSLAVAIWTMHFVGMLAARIPFPVDYLVFPTLLSFLVCVLVVGIAVFAISGGPLSIARLILSACLMGTGIFSMHYIGMTALHASLHMEHAPPYVAASWVIAVATSGLALWLATGRIGRPPIILSAVAFGIAVSGMHYTAMAGMTPFPMAMSSSGAPALSTDLLAIVVAVVAFCVSGIFLLVLVPERSREQGVAQAIATYPDVSVAPVFAGNRNGNQAQFGRGTYAPLGGAGGPPPRIAHHLPVERDGATHFIAVEDVVAVHANAHYTYVFNGTLKLFCPLAIGEVESRLDKSRFIRVHRSHIINIDRVIGHRRNGDSELVEMAASDHYSVPVSRSRIGWLKSRIGAKAD